MIVSLEYDIFRNRNINFLLDYSKLLMENKICDSKITAWQLEKADLLKKIGVEVKREGPFIKEENNKILPEEEV
jgi:hypothetical protein